MKLTFSESLQVLHSYFFIRTLKNLAEPEDVLISSHTFSLIFGQISASTFL